MAFPGMDPNFILDMTSLLCRKEAKVRSILFIGAVGAGKSATVNHVGGKQLTLSEINFQPGSLTKEIEYHDVPLEQQYEVLDSPLTLIDTPQLTKDTIVSVKKKQEIFAIALVIAIGRLRSEEQRVLEIFNNFERKEKDRTFIVFTRGDLLKDGDLSNFMKSSSAKGLSRAFRNVKERYILVDNNINDTEKIRRDIDNCLKKLLENKSTSCIVL